MQLLAPRSSWSYPATNNPVGCTKGLPNIHYSGTRTNSSSEHHHYFYDHADHNHVEHNHDHDQYHP